MIARIVEIIHHPGRFSLRLLGQDLLGIELQLFVDSDTTILLV